MNITEATERACKESTLLDALSWIALWESERAIAQAIKNDHTGERTASHGGKWDTCFKRCFESVMQVWNTKEKFQTY
jgi:hypothetical protein